MADSPKVTDVILEIATPTDFYTTQSVSTGFVTKNMFDQFYKDGSSPVNYNFNFDNFGGNTLGGVTTGFNTVFGDNNRFKDLIIQGVEWLSVEGLDSLQNPNLQGEFANSYNFNINTTKTFNNITYRVDQDDDPTTIMVFTMVKADGTSPQFDGCESSQAFGQGGNNENINPIYVNNHEQTTTGSPPYNRLQTEQGRFLYLRGQGEYGFMNISFEILEGSDNKLMVKGYKDGIYPTLQQIHERFDNIPIPESFEVTGYDEKLYYCTEEFWQNFTGTISCWEHNGRWHYDNGSIDLNSTRNYLNLTKKYDSSLNNSSSGTIVQATQNNLGFRMTNQPFFGDNNNNALPALAGDAQTRGYEMQIGVSFMQNCKILVLSNAGVSLSGAGGIEDFSEVMESIGAYPYNTYNNNNMYVVRELTEIGSYEVKVPFASKPYDYSGEEQALDDFAATATVKWSNPSTDYVNKRYTVPYGIYDLIQVVPIDDTLPYSCRIDNLGLINGGYDVKSTEIEIFSDQATIESGWNYEVLDILETDTVPLSLNFVAADLTDPGKQSAGYSKTFEIPASHRNQQFLKSMTADGSNRQIEDISWRKARIKAQGVYVFKGYARIEKTVTGNGGKYKCHIIQDPSFWPELIGNKKLCDLALEGHEKNYNNIVNSWTSGVDNQNYVYPIINYGEWSGGVQTTIQTGDIHPAYYVKAIVDQMFNDITYTVESNFFNTPFFKKLIIPYTSGEEYREEVPTVGEDSTFRGHASLASQDGNMPDIPATGVNLNTTRKFYPNIPTQTGVGLMTPNTTYNSVQNGYVVPFTGRYKCYYSAQVKIGQGGNNSNTGRWAAWLHVNGVIMGVNSFNQYGGSAANGQLYVDNPNSGPPGTNPSGQQNCYWIHGVDGNDWTTKTFEVDVDLNAGDVVQVALYGINYKTLYTAYSRIKDQDFIVYPTVDNAGVSLPSTVSPGAVLGCGVKQKDFLKGLTQMFNLQWTADNEAKKVFVEPYDDFYGSGKLVDWTQKIDKKSWSDKFIIEELAKTIRYKYKEDSNDKIVEIYNNDMDTELWSFDITNGELYRKETKDRGTTIFSPTFRISSDLTFNVGGNAPTMPCMWSGDPVYWGWFNTLDRPPASNRFNIRILNYWGMSPGTNWELGNDFNNPQPFSSYPYAYTYNYNHADIAAYEDNLSWYDIPGDPTSPTFQRGLFNRYWGNLYESINGGSALRTCKLNLTPTDISNFDFRDIIKIKMDGGVSTYWIVHKIKDYEPHKNQLTQVELIEWKQGLPREGTPISIQSTNYGIQTPSNSSVIPYNELDATVSLSGEVTVLSNKSVNNKVKTTNNLNAKIMKSSAPAAKVEAIRINSNNGFTNQSYGEYKRNIIHDNGIALGNNLVAKSNQIVLGSCNSPNESDILQIGGGYYDYDKQTFVKQNSLSISRNGDVCFYGGDVVAEFTTGDLTITGDVYYTDKNGNKKKVYLKNKSNKY